MIANIVDHRENNTLWENLYGVVEPTHHDNYHSKSKAPNDTDITLDQNGPVNLNALILWAQGFNGHMTLYIYDRNPM